jgi:hypothetical protein
MVSGAAVAGNEVEKKSEALRHGQQIIGRSTRDDWVPLIQPVAPVCTR